ncbi:MAG: sensor domain-containing diguanylate cyclase [candidate division WOR-3 bacterium]
MKKLFSFISRAQRLKNYIIKNYYGIIILIFSFIFNIFLLKGIFFKNYTSPFMLPFFILLLLLNFIYLKFYFEKFKLLLYPFSLIYILISHLSGGLNGLLKGIPYYFFLLFLPKTSYRIFFFIIFLFSEIVPSFLNKKFFDTFTFLFLIFSSFLIFSLKKLEDLLKNKDERIEYLSSKLRFFDTLKLKKEELYVGIKETPLPEEPYALFKRFLNYLSEIYFNIYKPQTLLFLFYDNIKLGFRFESGNSIVQNFTPSHIISENSPLISLGIKQKKILFFSEMNADGKSLGIYTRDGIYVSSCILVPIIHEGNLYGFVYMDSDTPGYFSEDLSSIFEKISKNISIILKFFFELKDSKLSANRYKALFELAKETSRLLEKEKIFEKIFEICKNIFEINIFIFSRKISDEIAEICYIFDEKQIIKDRYIYLNEDSLFSFSYESEYPLIFKRIKRETKCLNKENYGVKSAFFVPLKINGKIKYVFSSLSFFSETFNENDKEILNFLQNQCEIVLEKAEMYEKEKEMAKRDGLTGLYNHRFFQELLEKRIQKGNSFTLAMLDIDDFKKLNDFYGHPSGDKILLEISKILDDNIKGIGFCARYGGEEFALCIDMPKNEGTKKCEEIRKIIEEWDFYIDEMTKLKVTASFGVAGFPEDARKRGMLIEKADKALYLAKRKGKNRVYIYKQEEMGLF